MEDKRKQFIEALKARAKETREKALAEGKTIPSFKNPLIEKIKAARERAIADGKATPKLSMPTKMSDILKKLKDAQVNR